MSEFILDKPRFPPRRPFGVLVADQDAISRFLFQNELEQCGFVVWLASNGREAVELYRAHWKSIDLVLLDVSMPELDGPMTLKVLRGLNPEVLACFLGGGTARYPLDKLARYRPARVFEISEPIRMNLLGDVLLRLAQPGRQN